MFQLFNFVQMNEIKYNRNYIKNKTAFLLLPLALKAGCRYIWTLKFQQVLSAEQ